MRTLLLSGFLLALAAIADAQVSTRASFDFGLNITDDYAQLTGRTLLMPAGLKFGPRLAPEALSNKAQALATIEAEFAKQDLEVIRDGDKFIRLQPVRLHDSMATHLKQIAPTQSTGEEIPAGHVNWSAADSHQAFSTYGDLTSRNVLHEAKLPSVRVRLRTQNALTRSELSYAISAILALSGIALIDDGDRFTQAVPLAQATHLELRAPARKGSDTLISHKDIPVFTFPPRVMPMMPPPRPGEQPVRQESPNVREPSADSLLNFYAKLLNVEALHPKPFGQTPMFLNIRTPLTQAELLYAIETTLRLHNLGIESGPNTIQLVRLPKSPTKP